MKPRPVFSRAVTFSAFLLAAISVGALAACDENKGGGTTTTTASATPSTPSTAASASTTTMATNTASATATTAATADPTAPTGSVVASATASAAKSAPVANTGTAAINTATASAATTASAAPSDSAGGATACGGKDQPKCPLQAWMAGNMQPAMASKDPAKLAAALRASAKLAPPGYGDWAKFANDGAAAVDASKDVADGKASCKNCHGAYQKKYRTEMRDRKI